MNRFIVLPCVIAGVVFLIGCRAFHVIKGNGIIKNESRVLADFKKLQIDGSYTVNLVCQEKPGIEIESDENIIKALETTVIDGVLNITTNQNISIRNPIKLKITTNDISKIKINGSADLQANGISASKIELEVNGSGSVIANGVVKDLLVSVSGSANISTTELVSENAVINISGSAYAKINVVKSLNINISGSGTVEYFGNPEVVNQNISGSGSIFKGVVQK